AYYNPAILGKTPGKSFSAAVGVYKKFDTLYGDSADYTKTPLRINTGFFRALPASSGNIIEFAGWKLGMSIIVPSYDQFKGDIANSTTQTTNITYTDENLWVGGAASKELSDHNSIGFTVYYTARNYVRTVQDKTYSGTASHIYSSDVAITQNSVVGTLGYFHQLSDQWHLGASIRLPNLPVSSQASYFVDEINTNNLSNNLKINETQIKAKEFIPTTLRLGATYYFNPEWTFSGDVAVYEGSSIQLFEYSPYADKLSYQSTIQLNFGAEYKVLPNLHARAGIYTNTSAHPTPKASAGYLQGEKVDQLGFSANVHYISESKVGYSFGGYYTGGNGYAVVRSGHNLIRTTKSTNIFTMLVATSFYF
ncbi:MAG: hypothetical protein ACLGGX_06360, partial [Bdellovibrionia bacterium]